MPEKSVEVLITLPFSDETVAVIRAISPRLKVIIENAQQPDEIADEIWKKVDILYTNWVMPAPELVPNLKWIQFHWAGIDHILDAQVLKKPNLMITTASGASASQVAEYVVGMLLALGHHHPDLFSNQKKMEWPRDRWERFSPIELRGSTVGIVGYGSIGRQVARLLQPFGAVVLAAKNNAMNPEDLGFSAEGMGDAQGDFVHRLYPAQALRTMFKECDFVVVCVPKTPQTKLLIGEDEIAALPPSAFLVDVSRGGVVDHNALLAALKDRKIAGAALDVFPEEPIPTDSPLWKIPNGILTPHISGITRHYEERAVEVFITNLDRFVNNQSLLNLVDIQRGY